MLDPRRLVEVRAPHREGSGYLITDRLILTAWHVVRPTASTGSPGEVTIRIEGRIPIGKAPATANQRARIIWPDVEPGDDFDFAVLSINPSDTRGSSPVDPVTWASLADSGELQLEAIGYPDISIDKAKKTRDTKGLKGWTNLADRLRQRREGQGTFDIRFLDENQPATSPQEAWAAMSGAAVFANDQLVGIIRLAEKQGTRGILPALPVDRLFRREDVRRAIQKAGSVPPIEVAALGSVQPPMTPRHRVSSRSDFVGREAELARVLNFLDQGQRLITLTGAPGSGKTRLAFEVRDRSANWFNDGHCTVRLDALSRSELVLPQIAEAARRRFGVAPGEKVELSAAHYLAGRELLLVLDNFEHVIDAAEDVASLLATCPKLRILVTSRERLNLRDEQEFVVAPLTLPPEETPLDPARLQEYPALALFEQRRQKVLPEFRIDPTNIATVVEICRRLDGLPLAIELAAARFHRQRLDVLNARLKDRPLVLGSDQRDRHDRQRTMDAAVGWSYSLLSEFEQRLFRRLSPFAGSFTAEDAEVICFDAAAIESQAEDSLESLANKGLVEVETGGGVLRYRLLGILQEYAAERLRETGEREALLGKFALHWVEVLEQQPPYGTGRQKGWDNTSLAAIAGHVRVAIDWAIESRDVVTGLQLVLGMQRWWLDGGHVTEGRTRLEELLKMEADALSEIEYIDELPEIDFEALELIQVSRWQDLSNRVREFFARLLKRPLELEPESEPEPEPDPEPQPESVIDVGLDGLDLLPAPVAPDNLRERALVLSALLAQVQGDTEAASASIQDALRSAEGSFDDRVIEGVAMVTTGLPQSHPDAVMAAQLRQDLLLMQEMRGNLSGQARALIGQAQAALRAGNVKAAREYLTRCRSLASHPQQELADMTSLLLLSDVEFLEGNPANALGHLKVALDGALALSPPVPVLTSQVRFRLISIYEPLGDIARCIQLAKEALDDGERYELWIVTGAASVNLARLEGAAGRWTEAESHWVRAESIYRNAGARAMLASARLAWAWIELMRDRTTAGFRKCLADFAVLKDNTGMAITYVAWAEGAFKMAMYDEAIQAFKDAQRLFEAVGNGVGAANAILRIANAYRERREYNLAEPQYQAAQDAYEALNATGGVINTLRQRGEMLRNSGRTEEAHKLLTRALELARSSKDIAAEATCQMALGELFVEMRK